MKKTGLLHAELSKTIAALAHNDTILIGDAGMPCPEGVKFIDLAIVSGVPGFIDVVRAVMGEMLAAEAYIDSELNEKSPGMHTKLNKLVGTEFPMNEIPHEALKEMSKHCKAMVRTGEFTPYSNIILKAGCLF